MEFLVPLLLLGGALCTCFAEEKIECGTKGQGIGRIVGGTNVTTVGQWPWQITIQVKHAGFHFCGGSIIKPRWIVTAAHCFKENANPSRYSVTAGELNLEKQEGDEQVMEIAKIIRHSEFNKTGHTEYDIAVLKLKNKITFNDKVRPICLPTKRFLDGKICWATGWGHAKPRKIGEQPVGSTTLKQVKFPLVSDKECRSRYSNMTSTVICGGYKLQSKGACQGDSGGPVTCKNKDGVWDLAGVVSFGLNGCAQKNTYDFFTNMAKFKKWVEDQIKQN
ncbi:transmembrane protease serine 3 [Exaiptasia diaphana]|uniref:Peptidase S1 domain-containing protein n=1 Tax=Exaiptasia diaphana TaxID=2652724 RepID=A0A913Y0L6_EXADI|nr:transmembrane protease serine 3 [Exaiptasia diaphana]